MSKIFVTDIDGVLLDMGATWLQYIGDKYGVIADEQDISNWDLRKSFGDIDANEFFDYTYSQSLRPYPYAIQFIRELKYLDHRVIALSHRPEHAQEAAIQDCMIFNLDDIIFEQDKARIVKDLGATWMVDDKWENALEVGKVLGSNSFLLDKPWNKCLDIACFYTRTFSLYDTYMKVEGAESGYGFGV